MNDGEFPSRTWMAMVIVIVMGQRESERENKNNPVAWRLSAARRLVE